MENLVQFPQVLEIALLAALHVFDLTSIPLLTKANDERDPLACRLRHKALLLTSEDFTFTWPSLYAEDPAIARVWNLYSSVRKSARRCASWEAKSSCTQEQDTAGLTGILSAFYDLWLWAITGLAWTQVEDIVPTASD
jgi:hypothetical protein